MNKKARFWDRIASKYFQSPIEDQAAYEHKLELTREKFAPESEVLEFGCGTGGTALRHAAHVKHILATDISEKMLAFAGQQKAEQGVDNVTFQHADFDTLAAPAGSFDVVLGMSILHLLDDRRPAMAKVRDLLKPGGYFISSTACLGNKLWFMAPFLWAGRMIGRLPLVRIFTIRQLVDSVRDAGFEVEHEWVAPNGNSVFVIARKP
ncbi:MAG: class I SAM-dependent methyltransferase [Pseudomonadota bacterium]|nr:class I SAM-dependent methyltransferase [Pseudomonadota bacterium]